MARIISEVALTDPTLGFGSVTLPDIGGAIGEWWMGGQKTLLNRITGVAGTRIDETVALPVTGSSSAAIGNTSGFLTDVGAVSGSATLLMLVRPIGAGNPILCGPEGAGSFTNYSFMQVDADTFSGGNGQTHGATVQSTQDVTDTTKFTLFMSVHGLRAPSRLYRIIGNNVVTMGDGEAAYLPAERNRNKLRFGGLFNNQNGGEVEIAAAAIFDGLKGEKFLVDTYGAWKAYAEDRGLPVA